MFKQLFFLCLFVVGAYGSDPTKLDCPQEKIHEDGNPFIHQNEMGVYDFVYLPESKKMREIYGSYWNLLTLEYRRSFAPWIRGFTNLSYVGKSGKSLGFSHRTTFFLIPVLVGADFLHKWKDWMTPFVGLGLGGCYEHFKNESPYVPTYNRVWAASFMGRLGLGFSNQKRWNFELFCQYLYHWAFPKKAPSPLISHYPDMGGFTAGGGLGVRF